MQPVLKVYTYKKEVVGRISLFLAIIRIRERFFFHQGREEE